jgi:hypothetical protein
MPSPRRKLGRDWIGIAAAQLAISLIKNRLQDTYGSRMKFISGGTSSTSPTSQPTPQTAEKSGTRITRPSEEKVSLVRIIGEPTTPNEAATLAEDDKCKRLWSCEAS